MLWLILHVHAYRSFVSVFGGGGLKGENDDMMIYTKYKLMFAHYDLKFPVFVSIID